MKTAETANDRAPLFSRQKRNSAVRLRRGVWKHPTRTQVRPSGTKRGMAWVAAPPRDDSEVVTLPVFRANSPQTVPVPFPPGLPSRRGASEMTARGAFRLHRQCRTPRPEQMPPSAMLITADIFGKQSARDFFCVALMHPLHRAIRMQARRLAPGAVTLADGPNVSRGNRP